jgi:hypothetical protein
MMTRKEEKQNKKQPKGRELRRSLKRMKVKNYIFFFIKKHF